MKPISQRAYELALAECRKYGQPDGHYSVGAIELGKAVDEWQATVEERLASIGLGLVPGTSVEHVLASGLVTAATGGLSTLLGARAPHASDHATQTAARIEDPGPSRYDAEPLESEE